MPRPAKGDAAGVELTVLVFDPEMHLALQTIIDRLLIERNHIGFGFDGFQYLRNVIVGHIVVIVTKRDVFADGYIDQCLSLLPDAAGAVVTQD